MWFCVKDGRPKLEIEILKKPFFKVDPNSCYETIVRKVLQRMFVITHHHEDIRQISKSIMI